MAYGAGTIGAQGPQGAQGSQGTAGPQGTSYTLSGKGSVAGVTGSWVSTSETTTSTSFTNLTTVGPTVSTSTGTDAIVILSAITWNTTTPGATNYISFDVIDKNGTTTHSASEANGAFAAVQYSNQAVNLARTVFLTGLTSGSNTFRMKYKTNNGTAGFNTRSITIIPL